MTRRSPSFANEPKPRSPAASHTRSMRRTPTRARGPSMSSAIAAVASTAELAMSQAGNEAPPAGMRRSGAQHSQSVHAWVAHVPGLKVCLPSTPADAKGLLKSAIRDDNPVVIFEDKMMYTVKGLVPDGDHLVPIGLADVKREGEDVTVIATSSMVQVALSAADELEREGVSVEVVDPRTIAPLDRATLVASARKTGRVIVVEDRKSVV